MNKKGMGFPSIGTLFVLVLVIVVLAMAQNGIDTKTIDSTIDSLNWSKYGQNVTNSIQTSVDGTDNPIAKTILTIAGKAIDFFGYAIFEVSKLAMKLAKDNPDIINYKLLFLLLVASLIAPLIYPIFIIIVSLFLIIKEAIQNRKEKRQLKNKEELNDTKNSRR